MRDMITINTNGLEEAIRCTICTNPNQTECGCDGACQYDEKLLKRIIEAVLWCRVEWFCPSCGKSLGFRKPEDAFCQECGSDNSPKEGEQK